MNASHKISDSGLTYTECLTENGHNDVVFEDLNWAVRDEVETVEQITAVHDCVARWRVRRLELDGQSAQTSGTCSYSINHCKCPRAQFITIFGPGKPAPKSHSSCSSSSCCCYQFSKGPKLPKAFLIRSGVQRNFAHTFVLTLPTDLPSQIFHLFSN